MAVNPKLLETGFANRSEVLGKTHVERSRARTTPFTKDFQEYITQYCWGDVWDRPGLPRKVRSMLTIAMLVALGKEEELRLHIRASRNTGVTTEELKEVLLQSAVYAGVPAANSAFRIAQEILAELENEESQ
jgi:3-oxoadipate enol-lactonase/4-carboxymuconolactone decarboxylase